MKKIFKNWKTTIAGIATVATGVSLVVSGHLVEGISAILTGLGLTAAKDFDKTGV